jgi:hypothetical protein
MGHEDIPVGVHVAPGSAAVLGSHVVDSAGSQSPSRAVHPAGHVILGAAGAQPADGTPIGAAG